MIGTSTLGVAGLTGSLSTDMMVAGGVLIVLVLLTLYSGASQAVAIALAALFAPPLLATAKGAALISGFASDQAREGILLVVLFALLAVLMKMMSRDYLHMTSPIQAIVGGIAASCILLLVWIATPSLSAWFQFGPTISSVFSESLRFWWILAMFAVLAFARM